MATAVVNPYEFYTDRKGDALDEGKIYVGIANQDPELFPQACFWDAALTIPATQPLRSIAGYTVNPNTGNSPSDVFTANPTYSIRIRDKQDDQVFYSAEQSNPLSDFIALLASSAGSSYIGFIQSGANAQATTDQEELRFTVRPEQFLGTTAQQINRAIIEANARGGGIVELNGGTYTIVEPILMLSKVTLKGKGAGATIIAQGSTNTAWAAFTTSVGIITALAANEFSDIHVEGLSVHGLNSTPIPSAGGPPYAKLGIALPNTHRSSVRNCYVKDVATGINIYGTVTGVNDCHNLVDNCVVVNARSWSQAGNPGAPRGIINGTNRSTVSNCLMDNCYTGFFGSSDYGTVINNRVQRMSDDGFYINENYSTYIGNWCIGADTRAASAGSGFAINPGVEVKLIGNTAYRCENSGFRMRHSAALAPQRLTLDSNVAVDCGYGFLTDLTGADAWPAAVQVASKFSNNLAYLCQFNGFRLQRLEGSILDGNEALNNNQAGVTTPTRGGLTLSAYCINNVVSNNVCNDTQGVPTQTFGLYSYLAADSGASVENTGNIYSGNKTPIGTDLYFPQAQTMTVSVTILSGARNGSALLSYPTRFEGVPKLNFGSVQNGSILADAECPIGGRFASIGSQNATVIVDAHAVTAANRVLTIQVTGTYP